VYVVDGGCDIDSLIRAPSVDDSLDPTARRMCIRVCGLVGETLLC
jgi:hypothetical protein